MATIAEQLAQAVHGVRANALPAAVRRVAADLVLDVAGLCVAARATDYIAATLQSVEGEGRCTAIGHPAASLRPMPRSSTALPRTAKTTTIRLRAARCMPAP